MSCGTRRARQIRRLLRWSATLSILMFLVVVFRGKVKTPEPLITENDTDSNNIIDMFEFSTQSRKLAKGIPRNTHSQIEVIVVPFTHTDPGWLKKYDEYSNETDDTLNAMHVFLTTHPDVKFMWAETIFLEHWWRKQNDSVRRAVRKLVNEGRLELVGGSWVMTDEANPYFPVSVDNIIEGFQFISKEFGVTPSVLFTLDPFGHSNSIAYLYSQAGIHREVINRVSSDMKHHLLSYNAQRFLWKQYFDKSVGNAMWTHVFPYGHYDIPSSCGPSRGDCCQVDFLRHHKNYFCGDAAVPITGTNAVAKAKLLTDQLTLLSENYMSNVVIFFYGDDFRFTSSWEWEIQYNGLRQLFDVINAEGQLSIRFGTITDFFKELELWYKENDSLPPTVTGDFFPYASNLGYYWSGYYSTRPFYKAQERRLHWLLRAADLLSTQAQRKNKHHPMELESARRALLLFQHHDAITGTSRKHVMKDYSEQLHNGSLLAASTITLAVEVIDESQVEMVEYNINSNTTTSLKILNVTKEMSLTLKIVNTLPYRLEDVVRVRVLSPAVTVKAGGRTVEAQIEPYIHNGIIDSDTFVLSFRAQLHPLDISVYQLVSDAEFGSAKVATTMTRTNYKHLMTSLPRNFVVRSVDVSEFRLNGARISTVHDGTTGMLRGVLRKNSKPLDLKANYIVYDSHGGAYEMTVFGESEYFSIKNFLYFLVVKGDVQESVHAFAEGLYSVMTLKKVDGVLGEQLNYLFHINVQFERNREVAFTLNASTPFTRFYADSLGIQLLRRKPGVFYPMPTSAVIEDNDTRITVSSNVPHGCRCKESLTFEAIIERRSTSLCETEYTCIICPTIAVERSIHTDDSHGLGTEPDAIANDQLPVDMKFAVLVEDLGKDDTNYSYYNVHTAAGHISVQHTIYPPLVLVGLGTPTTIRRNNIPPLPCDFQLVNVRHLTDAKYLLTIFHHGVRKPHTELRECGTSLHTFLKSYLKRLGVKHVQETNLAGTDRQGKIIEVDSYKPVLEPFKFLSLLFSF